MTADWAAYTQTMQQLAAIRRQSAAYGQQRDTTLRQAQADVNTLAQRLGAQRNRLLTAAPLLKMAPPHLGQITAASTSSIAEALGHAKSAANQADTQAQAADTAASQPPLLPGTSPAGRATLVYGAWCLVAWLAQCALVLVSGTDVSAVIWSICGLPAIAFFAGYLTLSIFGQPRLGGAIPYGVRLGGAICFIGMPILWVGLIAAFTFIRT